MEQTQDRRDARQGRRLQLSLPQSFSFNYTEAGPKTPEPREPAIDANTLQPPNPPKVRIHRRRPFPAAPLNPADFDASNELSVPTIQLPELSSDFGPVFAGSELEEGLLAPATHTARSYKRYGRIISPPKTPLDQIFNSFDAAFGAGVTTQIPILTPQQTLESSLPQSPATFSDSEDSDDSSDSGPSWEEDFGSPEAEVPDAFSHSTGLSSPMNFRESRPSSFRSSMHIEKQKWTPEMDEHLWVTYMSYLADPVHTPFKMLPGTAPPLGVCHRVARDAKKSWKGAAPRSPTSPGAGAESADFMNVDNNGAEQFYLMPRHEQQYTRSLSAADMPRKSYSKWLRTEGSTRRRLRHLCKRNPTLVAHYHRLVQTRTPSPFESSSCSSAKRESRFASPPPADVDSAFATRDLNITLATSTAASMQPDAPLAQLAQDLPIKPRPYSTEYSRPARRGVHHRSQSLQLGLGLNQPVDTSKFRDLASPFHESQQPDWLSAPVPASTAPNTLRMTSVREDITEEGAPIKIHTPRPLSGSMKRRSDIPAGAQSNELATGDSEKRRSMIQNLFRSSVDEGDARFHGRASTVGAIRHSTCNRHLSDIFTPPTIDEQNESLPPPITGSHTRQSSLADQMSSYRLPAPPEIPRLASPFAPASNARFSRTFPRTSYHPGFSAMRSQQHTSAAHNRQTWDGTQSPHTRLY